MTRLGHRTYLDNPRLIRTERNDDLIERVIRAKQRGYQDDVRVAA
jgi:SOS response regulatory protein OraA/RecX